MSALRQPDFESNYHSSQLQTQQNNLVKRTAKQPQVQQGKVVKSRSFSRANNLPRNLKVLSMVQKASFALALTSMTTSVGLYISSVQIPEIWSQEYRNLENLQRQEHHLASFNERIKYQIANEAEKKADKNQDIAISNSESALFISPAKIEPKQAENNHPEEKSIHLKRDSWGY